MERVPEAADLVGHTGRLFGSQAILHSRESQFALIFLLPTEGYFALHTLVPRPEEIRAGCLQWRYRNRVYALERLGTVKKRWAGLRPSESGLDKAALGAATLDGQPDHEHVQSDLDAFPLDTSGGNIE
jgi:hypothetical protein